LFCFERAKAHHQAPLMEVGGYENPGWFLLSVLGYAGLSIWSPLALELEYPGWEASSYLEGEGGLTPSGNPRNQMPHSVLDPGAPVPVFRGEDSSYDGTTTAPFSLLTSPLGPERAVGTIRLSQAYEGRKAQRQTIQPTRADIKWSVTWSHQSLQTSFRS